MSDEIRRINGIESPCRQLCSIDPEARICVGCFRTMQEIATWSRMSPDERRDVTADLPARAPLLERRDSGR
ncbi:DUF1289 domain-containing protein [Tropicimonas sp. IMCC34043]|uniref:DUF1289 domain-containing protein n=1 Tax=Tropicimonas sp. IMCC34043 TaxID=2248760 RepID=UPI000E263586|nr:DUF1289 domain-containing protein [Tropicimonas sp. IMCC34043]